MVVVVVVLVTMWCWGWVKFSVILPGLVRLDLGMGEVSGLSGGVVGEEIIGGVSSCKTEKR